MQPKPKAVTVLPFCGAAANGIGVAIDEGTGVERCRSAKSDEPMREPQLNAVSTKTFASTPPEVFQIVKSPEIDPCAYWTQCAAVAMKLGSTNVAVQPPASLSSMPMAGRAKVAVPPTSGA
jgi:hypothetical protein